MNLRIFKLLYRTWWAGKTPAPPYSHVVQIGDPVLRQKANPVDLKDIKSEFLKQLYSRMSGIMKKTDAVGLSAPQIGIALRVFAIQCPAARDFASPTMYKHRQMQHIPFQIWVNPEVKVLDYEKLSFDEGCESMRGFSADVARYKKILLTGYDPTGESKSWEASGWSARIVQHEMDHLNGVLFTDIMDPRSLTCTCWDSVNKYQGRVYTTYIPGK